MTAPMLPAFFYIPDPIVYSATLATRRSLMPADLHMNGEPVKQRHALVLKRKF
jgi:hypothetical protein